MKKIKVFGLIVLGMFAFTSVQAQTLPTPKGKVILTVMGSIKNTNTAEKTAQFDRDMLMDLEVVQVTTNTPWSEGVDVYRGPLLRSLLAAVGASEGTLSVTALNDYSASVPSEDGSKYNLILAMDMNGEPMTVRKKGPLFLLYPFDEDPSLNNEVIHNRSVWQIKSITVE
ncbi:molybdopterin-dependent oxidoreductase [Marinomonas sp. IMCC 4694]|uniref:molybdopterin-dependent oxidoreductase n=1 Tax=Marinomonas sp. IMCC 4694 TaxID=2605432 RepID=UPI0011E758DE|nr:molybdopterin-dependent oxidoreductase [Marinomonas sp. IMCC 4694]TYL48040.1 molybdopterin-dependent oxidoreductase [Marinomonas sp. IMCC 4694]